MRTHSSSVKIAKKNAPYGAPQRAVCGFEAVFRLTHTVNQAVIHHDQYSTAGEQATRLKGEADGAAEKAHGEGVAAGIKAQTEAYNGMENAYLLANRYIDVMPEVAEAVAKPLASVDSIKMYGDGNATKLVRDTTGMVDQVTSGLKDATGIDLTELLSSFHQPFQPREDNE